MKDRSKKQKSKSKQEHAHSPGASTSGGQAPTTSHLEWGSRSWNPVELLQNFVTPEHLPLIVKVASARDGRNFIDTFTRGQMFLIKGWDSQQRAIVREKRGQVYSIPVNWPIKFTVRKGTWSRSKPKTLDELLKDVSLPQHVYFEKRNKWKFRAGKKEVSNFRFGGLDLQQAYTEHFLIGMPIINGVVETDVRKMAVIPLYSEVLFMVAAGLVNRSRDDWERLRHNFDSAAQGIDFTIMSGTEHAFLYKLENIQLNRQASYHFHDHPTEAGLVRSSLGDRGRLEPNIHRSLQAAGAEGAEGGDQGLDKNENVKVEVHTKASVSLNQNGAVARAKGTTTTSATTAEGSSPHPQESDSEEQNIQVIEHIAEHMTTSILETAKHSANGETTHHASSTQNTEINHVSNATKPIHVEVNSSVESVSQTTAAKTITTKASLLRPASVDLLSVPSKPTTRRTTGNLHWSKEDLTHEADAPYNASWGFMGGGYRSVVTVSHAGSDIVSELEDNVDYGRRAHMSRRQQMYNARYGSAASGHSPSMRKIYVARSVTGYPTSSTARTYSLSRAQGAGPMIYYEAGNSRNNSVFSHRTHSLNTDTLPRQTMSELGGPVYSPRRNYSLRTDIPHAPAVSNGRVRNTSSSLSSRSALYNDGYVGRPMGHNYGGFESSAYERGGHVRRAVSARRHENTGGHLIGHPSRIDQVYIYRSDDHGHVFSLPRGRPRYQDNADSLLLHKRVDTQSLPRNIHSRRQVHSMEILSTNEGYSEDLQAPSEFSSSIVDVSTGTLTKRRSGEVIPDYSSMTQHRPLSYGAVARAAEANISRNDYVKNKMHSNVTRNDSLKITVNSVRSRAASNVTREDSLKITIEGPQRSSKILPTAERISTVEMQDREPTQPSSSNKSEYIYEIESFEVNKPKRSRSTSKERAVRRKKAQASEVPVTRTSDVYFDDTDDAKILASKRAEGTESYSSEVHSSKVSTKHMDSYANTRSIEKQQIEINKHAQNSSKHRSSKDSSDSTPVVPPPPTLPSFEPKHTPQQPKAKTESPVSKSSADAISAAKALLQEELQIKLSQRNKASSHEAEQKRKAQAQFKEQRKSSSGKPNDEKANSLRQAYAKQRASLLELHDEKSIITTKRVDKESTNLAKIIETHDTLKSSGYGSVSSKPDSENAPKSPLSSPFIKSDMSVKREIHPQTNTDNPWALADQQQPSKWSSPSPSHKHFRDSILSIRELDEYLRSQSIGVDSDDETSKQFEHTELVPEFELTHL